MMGAGRVCVLGSFMADLVVTAPRRPLPGETLVGTSFANHLGGKGYNQAVAAARAGAATTMIGRLGNDDFGHRFRAGLIAEGIDDRYVATDLEAGTGVGLPVVEPDGQNSIIIVPRANASVSVEDVELAAHAIQAADVLLLQLELPIETATAAAALAAASGTRVILNPAPWAPLPPELFAHVTWLIPNENEAAQLLGEDPTAVDPEIAAEDIQARWRLPAVLLTLGEDGVLVRSGEDSTFLTAHPVQAIDTVGAGDVFCGALAAELAAGRGLLEAATYANAAAAIAVTRPGGADSAPARAEVEALAATPPKAEMV
jgi:ribokinase